MTANAGRADIAGKVYDYIATGGFEARYKATERAAAKLRQEIGQDQRVTQQRCKRMGQLVDVILEEGLQGIVLDIISLGGEIPPAARAELPEGMPPELPGPLRRRSRLRRRATPVRLPDHHRQGGPGAPSRAGSPPAECPQLRQELTDHTCPAVRERSCGGPARRAAGGAAGRQHPRRVTCIRLDATVTFAHSDKESALTVGSASACRTPWDTPHRAAPVATTVPAATWTAPRLPARRESVDPLSSSGEQSEATVKTSGSSFDLLSMTGLTGRLVGRGQRGRCGGSCTGLAVYRCGTRGNRRLQAPC